MVKTVRGTSDTLSTGSTYKIRGTYKLVSRDKAVLAINVTRLIGNRSIIVRDQSDQRYATTPLSNPNNQHRQLPDQHEIVRKREGSFTLRFHLWGPGDPHVSFYPCGGGESFLSTYFLSSRPGDQMGDRHNGPK